MQLGSTWHMGRCGGRPWKSFIACCVALLVAEADVPSLALALRDFIACNVDPKLPLHIELLVKMGNIHG